MPSKREVGQARSAVNSRNYRKQKNLIGYNLSDFFAFYSAFYIFYSSVDANIAMDTQVSTNSGV